MNNSSEVLFMSTFPPRKCGIATFTKDLVDSISKNLNLKTNPKVLAIDEAPDSEYEYSDKVKYSISVSDYDGYKKLARQINNDNSIKAVCIQHEFGIFGGEHSCHPLPFLDELQKPSFITFHSIFPNPVDEVRQQVRAISRRVKKIIVMTESGVKLLTQDYEITTPTEIIPHGIPNVSYETQNFYKQLFDLERNIVLSSFGMVGPGKGYEQVIESLPSVVRRFPNLIYLIIGATHPNVIEEEGENYRESLFKKIESLGLNKNVKFYNKYASVQEIIEFLKASDIYMSTSQNPEQITSGTLAYAMGCGRAIVSTPFPHAKDLIKENNGILVDYDNAGQFSNAIVSLLENSAKRKSIERVNYDQTRKMIWKNVAKSYDNMILNHKDPQTPIQRNQTQNQPFG